MNRNQICSNSEIGDESTVDWSFNGSNTQYSTHGIHTWLAAMIPAVARKIITITKPKSILDPFCGGGAVLVESMLSEIPATGVDINPLSLIVSKAKTTRIDKKELVSELTSILKYVMTHSDKIINFPKSYMIDYWYKPYMMGPLSALANAISSCQKPDAKNFYQCVLSATARDVSLTYRNEIRLRRLETAQLEKFKPDVIKQFISRAEYSIRMVSEIKTSAPEIKVINGNTAKELPFKDNEFTTIICSPPYGDERNGVPYTQFSKNMLFWLMLTREEIHSFKNNSLGWVGKRKAFDCPNSATLKIMLEKISHNERTMKEAKAFYGDYFEALKNMTRVTSDKIVIVIGQRVLLNNIFDNAKITTELLSNLGVTLETTYFRKLPSKRLPKMRDYGAAIDKESILVYNVKNKTSLKS